MKTKRFVAVILSLMIALSMCLCPVSAAETYGSVVHNIAQKYSDEKLVDDPNMMWFVADLAVYEQVYQQSTIPPVIRQECLDKIIAEADAAEYPSAVAKSIIALRSMGYDARNIVTAELKTIDVVKKLTDMVDAEMASVFNEYTLPYVILALQQGTNYATKAQMDSLIEKAVETKSAWQDTTWGTDAATPMLLALAPYYNTNEKVKSAIDETLPIIYEFQDETGLISNAASHGIAMAAFSALGIDNHSVSKNGKDMFDGLMTAASPEYDGFEPSYNSFSTEQGFRGLLSTMLPEGRRIYDFADYPYNQAQATWAEFAPVAFDVKPEDAEVMVSGTTAVSKNRFDLNAGTYNYSVYHSVYQTKEGTFVITPEEAEKHIPKNISVILETGNSSGNVSSNIKVNVMVMVHNENKCNNSYTYKNNASDYTTLVNESIILERDSSVLDALKKALNKNNIPFTERNGYVSAIKGIAEFAHGNNSGWMFTVDNRFSTKGSSETILSDGQKVIWFYTDDYSRERASESFGSSTSGSEAKNEKWGLKEKNPDIRKRDVVLKGKTFNDIKNHEKRKVIESLAERKIINGKNETTFDPEGNMTRSEFATLIVNGLCLPDKKEKMFDDVSDAEWFGKYISTAFAYGIVKGESDSVFNPNGTITREEAVVMLARAAKLCGLNTEISSDGVRNVLAQFTDYTKVADWAQSSLAFCYGNGILPDEAMEIKPEETVTRAEVADMLYNMLCLAKLM